MRRIDLNCDMGESFGEWQMGQDAAVMPWITSANIACGFHAGDFATMARTVELARQHDVAIGAHVSLPDLQGFGRREMHVTANEVYAMTVYQIGALQGVARAANTVVTHVKPHGALYNMAARNVELASAIADAIRALDVRLILVGLAASNSTRAATAAGLRTAHEGFADRSYAPDGSLTARSIAGSVYQSAPDIVAQALKIALTDSVTARNGATLALHVDTLCVHGDRNDAAAIAQQLRRALDDAGVRVAAMADP